MTLARNKAVDVIRLRSRHVVESLGDGEGMTAMDPGPDPAATYERRRTLAQVRSALDQLSSQVSPKSFQVLYLRWIEGRTTSEVADALALTPGQVRFRTHRMKLRFRDLLERSIEPDQSQDRPDRPGMRTATDFSRNTPREPASKS
jgi:RNA polymerase sigma factor (sigma-70 family)